MISINISTDRSPKAEEFEKKEWSKENESQFGAGVSFASESFEIIAQDDMDNVLGTLRMEIKAGVTYISSLIVADKFRRKGIGSQLLDKAEAHSRSKGVHKVYLFSNKDNPCCKFYFRKGYEEVATLPKFYQGKDFCVVSKDIEV